MIRAAAIALAAAAVLAAAPASADAGTQVVQGERIRIASTIDSEAATSLTPGSSVHWLVDVSVSPGEPGEIAISLTESGELGLDVAAYRCDAEWEGDECPTGAARIRSGGPLSGGETALLTMPHSEAAYLRLVATAPDDVPPATRGRLRLIAAGAGDRQEAGVPPAPLEPTGSSLPWAFGCAAVGVLIAGTTITAMRAGRQAPHPDIGRDRVR